MASQPPPNLPLFYKNLQPLSSSVHASYHSRTSETAPYFATAHAIPLTTDEFIHAQRHMPIVFSTGENPVPLALTGLNEGVNVFVDAEGKPLHPFYVPAYVRRYPYVLARLDPNAQELSLCFDPESDLIGDFKEGDPLFEDGKPSANLNNILKFCEDFEVAGQRTTAFLKEVQELDLLIEGEVTIQPGDTAQPFIYRGFRMVDEQKFRELHGDQLRRINQNGILPLIVAHLFSLSLIRDIFGRQMALGKVPEQPAQALPAAS
ncbi:MAG TPA: SapC family protein [Allosphingosinicella sp.]|nr:SapC family protein [Allosphingosinicella sp.]